MDFIVIIVGFYFILKFIFEEKKSKAINKEIDRKIEMASANRKLVENESVLFKYRDRQIKYSDVRDLVWEAISWVCENHDVKNSELFGFYENLHTHDRVLTGNKRTIALGLIMSKEGCLPPTWNIHNFDGLYFTNPNMKDGAQHNKEVYAIGKRIQQNLRDNGLNFHVNISKHKDLPNVISNTHLYIEEFDIFEDHSRRIDNISIDTVTTQ